MIAFTVPRTYVDDSQLENSAQQGWDPLKFSVAQLKWDIANRRSFHPAMLAYEGSRKS